MALGKGLNSFIPQQQKSVVAAPQEEIEGDVHRHGGVLEISVTEISPNPRQPRKHFSHAELEDLVRSIRVHGIMQPLVVTFIDEGKYELIAGERRLRAATIAELETVPVIVREATDQEKLELALIENIQRQELNPIEEAIAYRQLIDDFGLTQQEVADQVGKSRPAVANTVRLLDLPQEIQQALMDGVLTAGKARALLSLRDEVDQLAMFAELTGQKANVRDVERMVSNRGERSRKGSVRRDPNIMAQEQLLEERFGTKVRISQKGEKGKIEIEYYSKEELRRLMEEMA